MALEDQDETKNLDGFLSSAEKSATDDTDNIGQEDLQKQEEAPWVNGYQINKDYSTKKKDLKDQQEHKQFSNNIQLEKFKGAFRKKGPLTAIILTVVGGGIGFSSFFSPGLLIVQMQEVLVTKFNTQLTSMDIRTTKILSSKALGGVTGGICTTIKVACKYSSMTTKQIKNFENAGIKVITTKEPNAIGRVVPDEFEYNNKKIKPADFTKTLNSDPEFRTAVKKAYNPLFAGFSDSIFSGKVAKFLGISKKAVDLDGNTKEEVDAKVRTETKEGDPNSQVRADESSAANSAKDGEEVLDAEGKPTPEYDEKGVPTGKNKVYTAETAAAANSAAAAAAEAANEIEDGAIKVAESGTKAGSVALDKVDTALKSGASLATDGVANTLKISGIADNACTLYGMVQSLGYAAKSVRAVQLARYAMIFLNVASQIKAGTAKAEDVAYLGTILTTEVAATEKSSAVRSATDSFGYKYAAYGEKGTLSTIASQFLVGGGLTGDLINVTSIINKVLGGTPRKTCGFLQNPFVGVGSAIVGIASMTTPIGWGKVLLQGVEGVAISAATIIIPELLKDVVAGVVVDSSSVGESAAEAYVSGTAVISGETAAKGGNAPLTPTQAVAYTNLSNKVLAQYAEEDQVSYSPLDATNSNTFMGKIVASITPYISKATSLAGAIGSIVSISLKSISSLSPSVSASADEEDYKTCTDLDYQEMGLATGPYCNVIYGIPTEYLDMDPSDIAIHLNNADQIDDDGNIIGDEYKAFLNNCIDRTTPLGDSGDSFDESKTGSTCLINDSNPENKYYYVYYIDQRVETGMSGEDEVLSAAQDSGQEGISFYENESSSNVAVKTVATDNPLTTHNNTVQSPLNSTSLSNPIVNTNILTSSQSTYSINNLYNYSNFGLIKIGSSSL